MLLRTGMACLGRGVSAWTSFQRDDADSLLILPQISSIRCICGALAGAILVDMRGGRLR